MPLILTLAGMKSYCFMRRMTSADMPNEFVWEGIDRSRRSAFWLPLGYSVFAEMPGTPIEFDRLLRRQFNRLAHFGGYSERALLAGGDVSDPSEALPILVDAFNGSSANLSAKLATPEEFVALVTQRNQRAILSEDLNPVGQGIYSNRIVLKQMMREMEDLLTTAEKLSVIAASLGSLSNPR